MNSKIRNVLRMVAKLRSFTKADIGCVSPAPLTAQEISTIDNYVAERRASVGRAAVSRWPLSTLNLIRQQTRTTIMITQETLDKAKEIIGDLERKSDELEALFHTAPTNGTPAKESGYSLSEQTRERMKAAQRARWSIHRKQHPPAPKPPGRYISPEGRKRIVAAQRRRWDAYYGARR